MRQNQRNMSGNEFRRLPVVAVQTHTARFLALANLRKRTLTIFNLLKFCHLLGRCMSLPFPGRALILSNRALAPGLFLGFDSVDQSHWFGERHRETEIAKEKES